MSRMAVSNPPFNPFNPFNRPDEAPIQETHA